MSTTPASGPALLPCDQIVRSPFNRSIYLGGDALHELANSIKEQGVISPILCRPLPEPGPKGELYELVAGERRLSAARMAGLTEIPGFWRVLTDEQVIEIQLIENVQREGLTEIEEAEGYERLMTHCKLTADDVVAKVSKSRAYVYGRLKLLDLVEAGRKALRDGVIPASTALLVARIPVKSLQERAVVEIVKRGYGGEPMSVRAAAEHVQRNYMLRLSQAKFNTKDALLLPTAGACNTCPKRTGNQPALFADVDGADVCTDPQCHTAKTDAHVAAKLAAAKAEGQQVIQGKKAEEVKPYQHGTDLREGFVALDQEVWDDDNKRTTVRKLLGKDAPKAVLLADPQNKGNLLEILPKATIKEHLTAKGLALPAALGGRSGSTTSASDKERNDKEKRAREYRRRLFERCRTVLTQNPHVVPDALVPVLRKLASYTFQHLSHDDERRLTHYWIGARERGADDHERCRELSTRIPTYSGADCVRLMIEATAISGLYVPSYDTDHSKTPASLKDLAALLSVDEDALKLEMANEAKAAREAKAAKKTPKPSPKAEKAPSRAEKTASSPSTAARAGGSLAAKKAAPAAGSTATAEDEAKPKLKPTAKAKSSDRATAKPSSKPAVPATKEPDAAKYRHPENSTMTWSGRGRRPAWFGAWLAKGGAIADLEVGKDQAPASPAENEKAAPSTEGADVKAVAIVKPVTAWPFPKGSA